MTDRSYELNLAYPVDNSAIGIYYLRVIGTVESGTPQPYGEWAFTILKNCSIEALTSSLPTPIADLHYTFHATPPATMVGPVATSSRPDVCPVEYVVASK